MLQLIKLVITKKYACICMSDNWNNNWLFGMSKLEYPCWFDEILGRIVEYMDPILQYSVIHIFANIHPIIQRDTFVIWFSINLH